MQTHAYAPLSESQLAACLPAVDAQPRSAEAAAEAQEQAIREAVVRIHAVQIAAEAREQAIRETEVRIHALRIVAIAQKQAIRETEVRKQALQMDADAREQAFYDAEVRGQGLRSAYEHTLLGATVRKRTTALLAASHEKSLHNSVPVVPASQEPTLHTYSGHGLLSRGGASTRCQWGGVRDEHDLAPDVEPINTQETCGPMAPHRALWQAAIAGQTSWRQRLHTPESRRSDRDSDVRPKLGRVLEYSPPVSTSASRNGSEDSDIPRLTALMRANFEARNRRRTEWTALQVAASARRFESVSASAPGATAERKVWKPPRQR
jgi:hypothetical protein